MNNMLKLNSIGFAPATIVCLFLLGSESRAQTLISKLPVDGAWAKYDVASKSTMPGRRGASAPVQRSQIILRSVGSETIDGKKYRWIEMESLTKNQALRRGRGDTITIYKMLVPEQKIAEGKSPIGKIQKVWMLNIAGEKETLEEVEPGSVSVKQVLESLWPGGKVDKEIPAETIESVIGKLECEVVQFKYNVGPGARRDDKAGDDEAGGDRDAEKDKGGGEEAKPKSFIELEHTVYSNEKSPFGSVKSVARLSQVMGERRMVMSTTETVLKETGKGAKSAIPEMK